MNCGCHKGNCSFHNTIRSYKVTTWGFHNIIRDLNITFRGFPKIIRELQVAIRGIKKITPGDRKSVV